MHRICGANHRTGAIANLACLEKEKNHQYSETMDKRIKMLQRTIEAALSEHGQYGDSSDEGLKP